MELKELSVRDGVEIYEMLQQIGPDKNAFRNEVHGMSYPQYQQWLEKQSAWAEGEQLPEGYVRQWTFWLYDGETPVGYAKLRERVTEQSRKFGGNMGLAIAPAYRGNGYGTELFRLLIQKARQMRLPELYSTVEKFNYPSKAVHEKNGGVLVDENEARWFFRFPTNE